MGGHQQSHAVQKGSPSSSDAVKTSVAFTLENYQRRRLRSTLKEPAHFFHCFFGKRNQQPACSQKKPTEGAARASGAPAAKVGGQGTPTKQSCQKAQREGVSRSDTKGKPVRGRSGGNN